MTGKRAAILVCLGFFIARDASLWVRDHKLRIHYAGDALRIQWHTPHDCACTYGNLDITDGSGVHVSVPLERNEVLAGNLSYRQPLYGNVTVRLTTYCYKSATQVQDASLFTE